MASASTSVAVSGWRTPLLGQRLTMSATSDPARYGRKGVDQRRRRTHRRYPPGVPKARRPPTPSGKKALILLENLNTEPADAEVHYLAHMIEKWRFLLRRYPVPALRLWFTVNHAHLVPEGAAGFVDAIDSPEHVRDSLDNLLAARDDLALRADGVGEACGITSGPRCGASGTTAPAADRAIASSGSEGIFDALRSTECPPLVSESAGNN